MLPGRSISRQWVLLPVALVSTIQPRHLLSLLGAASASRRPDRQAFHPRLADFPHRARLRRAHRNFHRHKTHLLGHPRQEVFRRQEGHHREDFHRREVHSLVHREANQQRGRTFRRQEAQGPLTL